MVPGPPLEVLDNAISRFREAGDTDDVQALRRGLDMLEEMDGRWPRPTDNRTFFALQREKILLQQLRNLQASGTIPGFAGGVENFRGGLAYVHKGEMLANLPPGTDVIPRGRWGSGTVIHLGGLHFNGTTIGTAYEFERQVKGALEGLMRSAGMTQRIA